MNKPVNRAAAAVMHARAAEIVRRLPAGPCTWVEVGVWRGDNARRVMHAAHDRVSLVAVDQWRVVDSPDYRAYATKDALASQADMERYHIEAVTKLRHWRKRVKIVRLSSVEAAATMRTERFDLIFIDAEHTYPALTADILAWRPLVKPSGWLGGHDFGKDRFPGVTRAVNELCPERELGSDSTWWVRV
jgi:hypothetical protein